MNHSTYLFGEFGFGYTQYPDDYAKDIFNSVATNNEGKAQIAIRRDTANLIRTNIYVCGVIQQSIQQRDRANVFSF